MATLFEVDFIYTFILQKVDLKLIFGQNNKFVVFIITFGDCTFSS